MKKIFIIILFFIVVTVLYQLFMINKYSLKKEDDLLSKVTFQKDIIIKSNSSYNQKYNIEDMYFVLPNEFTKYVDRDNFYIKGNKDIILMISNPLYNIKISPDDFEEPDISLAKIIIKNNQINNIYDLNKFIITAGKKNVSIFSAPRNMKEMYFAKKNAIAIVPTNEYASNFSLIKGDLKGYAYYGDKGYIITLLNNNKIYTISFLKENSNMDYSLENVIEFLKSVSFK